MLDPGRRIKGLIKISGSFDGGKAGSEGHLWDGCGWIGSAWVSVSFVSALEAVEVGSSVSNEDVYGGRPETQSPKAMPGSGAIEMSGFWEQRTEDQAQESSGDF